MAGQESPSSLLLALPDPCLLEVLRCCAADDQRSLFSAARTHSRLHQAAVLALRSITMVVTQQQQMDGVLLYLSKHGQHVDSIQLQGPDEYTVVLRQLPHNLQLKSLQLDRVLVQLQPGDGFEGVLGAAARVAALKQLCITGCKLPYGNDGTAEGLAAALSLLPAGLEHLSVVNVFRDGDGDVDFPTGALQQLQQLTYLELACMRLLGPDQEQPALQPLQALTGLADLRLNSVGTDDSVERPVVMDSTVKITASMLSGMHSLTCLQLEDVVQVEPGALAGRTKLQHLEFCRCNVPGGAAGASEFLSHLQQLHQLTHLTVSQTLQDPEATPPAAAYSALTASSNLQHLFLGLMVMPAGAWQHTFPAGRQLPHLQYLDISAVMNPKADAVFAKARKCSRLVSCCPGLQILNLLHQRCKPQLLAPLQGLTGLHRLAIGGNEVTADDVQAVCQLTGLRELSVLIINDIKAELLLPLAQLQQLTMLRLWGMVNFVKAPHDDEVELTSKAPGDEPVWRQLLQFMVEKCEPEAAQQAAAALAERQ